ncbi:SAM-dependent methyltransferase [Nocardia sp. NPDC050712]|uniref:SAM-dependent methyltransferase n=1 Tax=Nocardia sp. NPDC050712 TaxID=3155518 RepID=UPI0033DAE394
MAQTRVPMGGVAMTAIGVAVIRVLESERSDRLYEDPLARSFVDAARAEFAATEAGAQRWAQLEQLADAFFAGRSMTVRLVDDGVRAALARGCRQIVLLGAGLDTRAFRMNLPAGIRFYEIDLPELFAFKEPVLAAAGAEPTCVRHALAADLRADWAQLLRDNDFHPDVPTHWIDEGVLGYLNRSAALQVAETLTDLSAPGSDFGVAHFDLAAAAPHYAELGRIVQATPAGASEPRGLGPDAGTWLATHGWHTDFRPWNSLVAPYARGLETDDPSAGITVAVRQ